MKWLKTKRLAIAITAYWVLLAYIVAMLAWWFIALQTQNRRMAEYRMEAVRPNDPLFRDKLTDIRQDQQKMTARNIGEGSTFLLSILVGAMFVYREVRRQIKLQQQQQNLMMAVTHELKTPIAVTKLNLETLQKHRLDEQKQQQLIRAALQETARLDTLANNILIASQLEGGGYIQAREELDLSLLVAQTVDDFKRRFPERKWDSHIEPGLNITGDRLLLQILVSNLTENALKYTPREGTLSIILEQDHSQILLSVKDQGEGIPDNEKKAVFEKFYRSSNERTRSKQGTGLGLWLCRKIAYDHRASLKLTDNSPSGSIFTVAFQA